MTENAGGCVPWLTTSARGRRLIEEWFRRGWGQRDVECAEEMYSSDVAMHTPFGDLRGLEPLKSILADLLNATTDFDYGYQLIGANHDFALTYWARGKVTGSLYGLPPTGGLIELCGAAAYKIENGMIREFWQSITSTAVESDALPGALAQSPDLLPSQSWALQWGLTPRETGVAEQVMQGLSDKEVAENLGLAPATVHKYVHRLLKKAGVKVRSQLAERAGLFLIG